LVNGKVVALDYLARTEKPDGTRSILRSVFSRYNTKYQGLKIGRSSEAEKRKKFDKNKRTRRSL